MNQWDWKFFLIQFKLLSHCSSWLYLTTSTKGQVYSHIATVSSVMVISAVLWHVTWQGRVCPSPPSLPLVVNYRPMLPTPPPPPQFLSVRPLIVPLLTLPPPFSSFIATRFYLCYTFVKTSRWINCWKYYLSGTHKPCRRPRWIFNRENDIRVWNVCAFGIMFLDSLINIEGWIAN